MEGDNVKFGKCGVCFQINDVRPIGRWTGFLLNDDGFPAKHSFGLAHIDTLEEVNSSKYPKCNPCDQAICAVCKKMHTRVGGVGCNHRTSTLIKPVGFVFRRP
jgi:hypothetical protein